MSENITLFSSYLDRRKAKIKEKAMYEINGEDIADNYEQTIEKHLRHLSFLQRYMVEEFFYEVMIEVFILGTEASRPINMGRQRDEVIKAYLSDIRFKINRSFEKHRLFHYICEMDADSVFILIQKVADQWFLKGIRYGEKQRKLRLI